MSSIRKCAIAEMRRKVKGALRMTVDFLKYRVYAVETLVLFDNPESTIQDSPARIEYISSENVSDVRQFQHPKYENIFREFLSSGDTGYFAYLDGHCVHRSWVKHTPQKIYLHPLVSVRLHENEAYIHYCETSPSARGRNIYATVLARIVEDHKDRTRIMICTNAKNISSLSGIRKAGFKERYRIDLKALLGIRFVRYVGD